MQIMAVWSPLADDIVFRPSPNYGYDGHRPKWRAITWHITEGTLESTLAWLCDPRSQASAHVVVARDGTLYNLVPLSEAAWCQGRVRWPDYTNPIVRQTVDSAINPNLVSYSIECVGFTSEGRGGSLTEPQAAALQRVTAYLCWRSSLSCDRAHILGHSQWDAETRARCPGFSREEWEVWIARAANLARLWRGW